MSAFDPTAVRQAVEDFTPRRPQKFHDLFPAKDFISELRQKRHAADLDENEPVFLRTANRPLLRRSQTSLIHCRS